MRSWSSLGPWYGFIGFFVFGSKTGFPKGLHSFVGGDGTHGSRSTLSRLADFVYNMLLVFDSELYN
jgi:hypothetical protein